MQGCAPALPLRLGTHPWIGHEPLLLARDLRWLPPEVQLQPARSARESVVGLQEGRLVRAFAIADPPDLWPGCCDPKHLTPARSEFGLSSERDAAALDLLENFWSILGCRIRKLTPEDHDYAVARISHFPHAMASMVAMVGLSFEDIAELAGGGLRDTTRVAAGDPELWTEILLENRDAMQRSLTESIDELEKFQEILRKNDAVAMLEYLSEAKRRRDLI